MERDALPLDTLVDDVLVGDCVDVSDAEGMRLEKERDWLIDALLDDVELSGSPLGVSDGEGECDDDGVIVSPPRVNVATDEEGLSLRRGDSDLD